MLRPSLFQSDASPCLFDGVQNRVAVHGTNTQKINDFTGNAFSRHDICSFQGFADFFAVSDEGHICSLSFNLGLANRNDKVLRLSFVRHWEGNTVHQFVFQNHNWIRISNRGFDQALGILTGIRSDDLETWNTSIPRRETLRVLGCRTSTVSIWTSEDNRTGQVSSAHVELLRCTVQNMIDSLQTEIPSHEFDNRSEIMKGSSNCHSCESSFGNRGVDDSFFSILLIQAFGDLVGPLILGDFLSHDKDGLVAFHLLVNPLANGFTNCHFLCGETTYK
mmetsp:Transcript_1397/g.2178  ORF Transcript_1397/g.2178 Transcript_1397/m.2178 type:complete len:277 (+) Transcript_1397:316-1146(+)